MLRPPPRPSQSPKRRRGRNRYRRAWLSIRKDPRFAVGLCAFCGG
jgi:hypothetical protein